METHTFKEESILTFIEKVESEYNERMKARSAA